MFRYTILFALMGCTGATAAPAAPGTSLTAASHVDGAPKVDVSWQGDGTLRLQADCSGCIDDVRLLEWTAADAPSARHALAAHISFDAGARDAFTSKLATPRTGAVGIDAIVAWIDPSGARRETTRTFFARFGKDGSLTPISWAEFAVERGYASRTTGRDGNTRLELNLQDQAEGNLEVQP